MLYPMAMAHKLLIFTYLLQGKSISPQHKKTTAYRGIPKYI